MTYLHNLNQVKLILNGRKTVFICSEICSEKRKHEPRYTWSKIESLQNSTYGGKQDIYKAVH